MSPSPDVVQAMLASEVSACKAVLASGRKKCTTNLKVPMERFVARSFRLHRRLVERWQGWRFHGEPFLIEDTTLARKVAAGEWDALHREAGNLTRDGKVPEYAGRVYCQANVGEWTLSPEHILSQKTLAPMYQVDTSEQFGQQWVKLDPKRPLQLIIGTVRRGSSTEHMYCSIRVGQRISACILDALLEAGAHKPIITAWEKTFQRLGELAWTAQNLPIQVTLSCAPSSFLRLGEYGENSCYRHGGEGEYSKFWLAGDCPDSFVALFHRLKDGQRCNGDDAIPSVVAGRAWGIACPKRGALVTNFYQLPSQMVISALENTVSAALAVPNPHTTFERSESESECQPWHSYLAKTAAVYLNRDVHLIYNQRSITKDDILRRYLACVINESATYGFWCRKAKGPSLLQMSDSVYRIIGAATHKFGRALWPYKDISLKEEAEDAVSELGLFLPITRI